MIRSPLSLLPAKSAPRRKASRGPRSRGGFTLVEAMVGMLVVGIALAGVFATLGRSFEMIEEARDSTRVAQIIQSELEDLRTLSWSDVDALDTWEVFNPSTAFAQEFGDRYTIYRYKYARAADQFGLRVYVMWTNDDGHTKYDFFETWYTKGGFNDYYYRSF